MVRQSNAQQIVNAARKDNESSTKPASQMILNFLADNYGLAYTSYELNLIAHTVDARKYISELRKLGNNIMDEWFIENGKRFKYYWLKK